MDRHFIKKKRELENQFLRTQKVETIGETAKSKKSQKLRQNNLLCAVERCMLENSHDIEIDQRINIKFCYKLGKIATETHTMLVQVNTVIKKDMYDRFKRFREEREPWMTNCGTFRSTLNNCDDRKHRASAIDVVKQLPNDFMIDIGGIKNQRGHSL